MCAGADVDGGVEVCGGGGGDGGVVQEAEDGA